jgi:hypothetical protein
MAKGVDMKISFVAIALAGATLTAFAQEGSKPAPVLTIYKEGIKEGREAAHEKLEADYAAAFRKLNHPAHYVALSSQSGPSTVWFIQPAGSFAATQEYDAASDKEPAKSLLASFSARDGELRSNSSALWAVHRPDLSYHTEKFNRAKQRYVNVATYRVRLGHDDEFFAAVKAVYGAYEKANVDLCILTYQITAGAPAGTYLLIGPMESMKVLDGAPARSKAMQEGMGQENFAKLMKSSGDMFVSIENTLFAVKPGMSYVAQEIIDADPAFWKPKAPKPAAAPAVPEKKSGQ